MVKKRRTKAEVEHDRAVLQMERDAEQQKKDKGIARVAQLEDQMAVEDSNAGSAHPRSCESD